MSTEQWLNHPVVVLRLATLNGETVEVYVRDESTAADMKAGRIQIVPAVDPPWSPPTHAVAEQQDDSEAGLLIEVRTAVRDLLKAVGLLRRCGWPDPYIEFEQRAHRAVEGALAAISADPDMELMELLKTLVPVMDAAWPGDSSFTTAARTAVDRIRRANAKASYGSRNPNRSHVA